MIFELSEKETELASKFEEEHRHPDVGKGAIGGHINYIFTPTSIGVGISMHCNICGVEENITDYDNW